MSKMDCNVVEDLIPLYIDNVCSLESKRIVEDHLKECHDCKNMYESMKSDMLSTPECSELDLKGGLKYLNNKMKGLIISICVVICAIVINMTSAIINTPSIGNLIVTVAYIGFWVYLMKNLRKYITFQYFNLFFALITAISSLIGFSQFPLYYGMNIEIHIPEWIVALSYYPFFGIRILLNVRELYFVVFVLSTIACIIVLKNIKSIKKNYK